MILGGAENQRLLALIDRIHEELHAVGFALFDLDDLVEVLLLVAFACLGFALDELIIGRVHVLVERRGDLLDLERRQKAVVDALLQRVDVHGTTL